MKRLTILALPAITLAASLAIAQDHDSHADHMKMMHEHMHGKENEKHDHSAANASKSESTRAFEEANAKMHRDMGAALTGDPDVDFMQGMIPHHQGAIDMAEIALKYGKDPEVRKLADEVIKAQTAEIAFMKDWLAKRGK
jgi:uncharacterized protein (DUF305 family)